MFYWVGCQMPGVQKNKFKDKGLISVYRSNKGHSTTYNTPSVACKLHAIHHYSILALLCSSECTRLSANTSKDTICFSAQKHIYTHIVHCPINGGFAAFTVKPNPILWLKNNKSSGFSLAPELPLICTSYVFLPSQAQQGQEENRDHSSPFRYGVPVSIRSNGSTPSPSTKERSQVVGYPLKTPLIHRDQTEAPYRKPYERALDTTFRVCGGYGNNHDRTRKPWKSYTHNLVSPPKRQYNTFGGGGNSLVLVWIRFSIESGLKTFSHHPADRSFTESTSSSIRSYFLADSTKPEGQEENPDLSRRRHGQNVRAHTLKRSDTKPLCLVDVPGSGVSPKLSLVPVGRSLKPLLMPLGASFGCIILGLVVLYGSYFLVIATTGLESPGKAIPVTLSLHPRDSILHPVAVATASLLVGSPLAKVLAKRLSAITIRVVVSHWRRSSHLSVPLMSFYQVKLNKAGKRIATTVPPSGTAVNRTIRLPPSTTPTGSRYEPSPTRTARSHPYAHTVRHQVLLQLLQLPTATFYSCSLRRPISSSSFLLAHAFPQNSLPLLAQHHIPLTTSTSPHPLHHIPLTTSPSPHPPHHIHFTTSTSPHPLHHIHFTTSTSPHPPHHIHFTTSTSPHPLHHIPLTASLSPQAPTLTSASFPNNIPPFRHSHPQPPSPLRRFHSRLLPSGRLVVWSSGLPVFQSSVHPATTLLLLVMD
ncbi:hypothetical protein PHYBLDRAFT_138920 [Phycomyces blakesleeanus NRRL 1555(-)]|uniref:Uncharacterized protein n=1 Tax=Phycomyces blakesleeanus (strain ATCC 8743b / DSM 1359 / FGSC 10004 / NBRC 33097 / NRRL 1555) TaxID=763407 RepID=A0A167RD02_PHYB8|nr:hypothetical protein PHYBLDRAFT_138920 [Phycomyces blakesleeanus NRRL 1555(-)]OAD81374.1 hypothetical protein PHYBLDRAFT_138920 [Phycomyces blakesleeanus NRRL 1555(-)]|eukprot:XP_018299414.1 hypothetical protein PHYBLDRAFT_138920 [Phycomyces blakesleeanus NRRL 1555(-)]